MWMTDPPLVSVTYVSTTVDWSQEAVRSYPRGLRRSRSKIHHQHHRLNPDPDSEDSLAGSEEPWPGEASVPSSDGFSCLVLVLIPFIVSVL